MDMNHDIIVMFPTKPFDLYLSVNSLVVDAQLFYFTYTHSRAVTKIDVINSNVQISEHNLVKSG